jgi:ADP-ribose pyrophosphatase YjhB (NUDIX family)
MRGALAHLGQSSGMSLDPTSSTRPPTVTPYDGSVEDPRVRPLALALIRRGNDILVERGRDARKGETFFRLLGGTIEFGERGAEAIRRELREELASEIEVNAVVATFENLFTWEGNVGHEIILVFECALNDASLYLLDEWEAHEETPAGSVRHEVAWKSVDSFGPGLERLYPTALITLLQGD